MTPDPIPPAHTCMVQLAAFGRLSLKQKTDLAKELKALCGEYEMALFLRVEHVDE